MYYERFERNRDYQIRNQVISFLHKLNIDNTKAIDTLKILSCIAKLYNVTISWKLVNLDGLPGFTCYNFTKKKCKMFLDIQTSQRCPERTKFTIAHELGHIVLKHFGSHNNSTYIINNEFETEANIFADELLMPTLPIIKYNMTVDEVCNTYKVSKSAASNKIHYMPRNPIYREERQLASTLLSIIDNLGNSSKNNSFKIFWHSYGTGEIYQIDNIEFFRNQDEYNERIIENYLDKWLEPG